MTKKSTIVREVFSTRLNPEVVKRLKHLAVDEKKTVSQLIEEGIEDLLKKYFKRK
jgi:predicted transcriptional regulator